MIIVTNIKTVNPEKRDEAVAEMKKITKISRQVSGIIRYGFYADLDDVNTFRFYAEFESVDTFKTQHQSQHFKAFVEVEKTIGITTSNGIGSYYTPISD
jgi:quinol monooxygenase YgiN